MNQNTIYTKERTAAGTVIIPIETDLLSERIVFLDGEIDSDLALSFLKQIMKLIMQDSEEPIKVIINSPGGSVDAGLLIYDIIQSTKTKIEMYCTGTAYSMGALIFLSGRHGRFLLEHSKLMLHEPLIKNFPGGNTTSVASVSDSLKETKKELDEIISKHTGKTAKEIAKATSYDHYFSAKEAIDFGLADEIVTADKLWEEL